MLQTPQQMPVLPSIETLEASSAPSETFDAWESECKQVQAANDLLFTKDLKRMNWCAFINGMLNRSTSNHFSWCPHENWESYWTAQGWPKLPTID